MKDTRNSDFILELRSDKKYFRFAFTIGNILDATVNKPNSTVTPDTY